MNLTDDEHQKVTDYLQFILSQRNSSQSRSDGSICVFDSSARNLPFDAKDGSNFLFERLCSFVDYEVRALGDKHRAVMLVIDDGVPFADVLCRKLTALHPLKVERRRLPAALVASGILRHSAFV